MTIERKSDVAKMSKKERREKFNDWYDPRFKEAQWRHGEIKSMNFYDKGAPSEEIKITKTASNVDRKMRGWELDPEMDKVPCDGCQKEGSDHKMKMIDTGSGLKYLYYCAECQKLKVKSEKK